MCLSTQENNIKLSILILTHNRPILFKRCLNSILSQNFNCSIEILVNNDSNDIEEISNDIFSIKYFYKSSNNLSDLYKHLFDQAKGEYVYFLEDDDYLYKNFACILNKYIFEDIDLYYMKYKNPYENKYEEISLPTINTHFQLSQILFKKELVENSFPDNNSLDNDWKLFQTIINKTDNIKLINNIMFIQTYDGKDNISFPKFNKDIRWNQ